MKQFEIYYADLSTVVESEQAGIRPVIVLQNYIKDNMEIVICAPITNKIIKENVYIDVTTKDEKCVYIVLDQIKSLDKKRLISKIDELIKEDYQRVKDKYEEVIGSFLSKLFDGIVYEV